MKTLIEVEGPLYVCNAVAAVAAVLMRPEVGGHMADISHEVIPQVTYVLEWFGDRVDEEGTNVDPAELRHMINSLDRLRGQLEAEIKELEAAEAELQARAPRGLAIVGSLIA